MKSEEIPPQSAETTDRSPHVPGLGAVQPSPMIAAIKGALNPDPTLSHDPDPVTGRCRLCNMAGWAIKEGQPCEPTEAQRAAA